MGLSFQAGPTTQVFESSYAREVSDALERRFGFISESQHSTLETFVSKISPPGLVRKPRDERFCSEEVAWSGWEQLQQDAQMLLGRNEIPHLLAVDAWQGVYLPIAVEPQRVRVNREQELQVASLLSLVRESLAYSSAVELPVEEGAIKELWLTYMEDDDKIDSDMHIQTYLQLMKTAQYALRKSHALWIVK
jgi:hypothetical protein